jgi:galactokinase
MDQRISDHIRTLGQRPADFPYLLRSPGRINVIGEHTDYNGGLVMPAAIDRSIYFCGGARVPAEWKLHAIDIDQSYTLPLPITGRTGITWVDYLAGIGVQFQDRGHFLPGLEIIIGGDLPVGSGMSSSAALEGGMAFLLNELLGAGLGRPELAQLCQLSSNHFMQIPTGIMDQFASLNGRATGPIVLNCATLAVEPVKNGLTDHTFILVNSMVSHDLSDGAYAERVAECREAFRPLQRQNRVLEHLSDAKLSDMEAVKEDISSAAYRRAAYVIRENERVRQAILAIEAGSPTELGGLLNQTHAGLRDEYEVSCPELDFLQATASSYDFVAGSRLMGGGFGGCTLNLVATESKNTFTERIRVAYREEYDLLSEVYPVRISSGTEWLVRGF